MKVKRCERLSDSAVSGQSLHVGAAEDLLFKGYDLAAIMCAGGWSNAETVCGVIAFYAGQCVEMKQSVSLVKIISLQINL